MKHNTFPRGLAPANGLLSPRAVSYIGRTGYIAKGIVYGLFGLLALRGGIGGYGKPQGTESAFYLIVQQPLGRIWLAGVGVGLLAFVVWRGIQLFLDPEDKGSDFLGWGRRVGCGLSGLIYLSLAATALGGAFGSWGSSTGKSENTARILTLPGGQVLVIAVGLGVLGVGAYHFYRVHTASFMQSYDLSAMSEQEKTWAERIGRYGLGARGVTFLIMGAIIARAGISYDSSEVGGLGDALHALSRRTFGQILFLILAAGFVAYGIYCLSRARYKQFFKRERR